jgi:hypothetical protein
LTTPRARRTEAQPDLDVVPDYTEVADGRRWLLPERVVYFSGDLPNEEQELVWATAGSI